MICRYLGTDKSFTYLAYIRPTSGMIPHILHLWHPKSEQTMNVPSSPIIVNKLSFFSEEERVMIRLSTMYWIGNDRRVHLPLLMSQAHGDDGPTVMDS